MAAHALTEHFGSFFGRLNPTTTFEAIAASQYGTIKGLIEDRQGLAAPLEPICFLQGSYKQSTAIYTINDVDIVALCRLWQPGSGDGGGRNWSRDDIFGTIAAPLLADGRYRDKVRYHAGSMCIKVELGIKVEILPVVFKAGNSDYDLEPFRLYRPSTANWHDGYARLHQQHLTSKNRTNGNFIPMVKVLKHLRSHHRAEAVSFHLECLLCAVPSALFNGCPADYIANVLWHISQTTADTWWSQGIATPCGERNIFSTSEWQLASWRAFHERMKLWANAAALAATSQDRGVALQMWRTLLGDSLFPERA